jgi:dCMP deaminase
MTRLTHQEYFFKVVEAVALRSTCDRGRSGAVLVKENRIIATGYVGSPPGMPHCYDQGHILVDDS